MRKQRYVSPFTDFGFKKLFGEEAHKNLLIDFLNSLLPEKHQIQNLEYTKNEASGATQYDRRAVFDIACIGTNGERFIVELQKAKQNYFKDRSVFYATFPIQEQAERGDIWDFELAAVYCIGILDFIFDENRANTDYMHVVQLKNQRNQVFYDKLMLIYLEMPKFTKTEAELVTHTDKWLYFIRHLSLLDDIPSFLQEQIFEQAFKTAEIAQFTRAEYNIYEASLKSYRDNINTYDYAVQEALKKGLEQGLEQGIEQGIEQGREEERQASLQREQEERLNIARNLKALGISTQDIAKATGLSEAEISALS
ncbi:MAG: Rpn family recombination-promoting nuclease/putative transposase [Candidatus Kapabacteria bacterium]|nr:Rpn family recombination-promoting nuclease/putative transposase [Candidatus Kapabacteria bacterium]